MRKNIILTLVVSIGILIFIRILSCTSLYFTDEEAIVFLNYLSRKNSLIDVNNGVIWFFIITSIILTYLNKISKEG